MSEELVKSIPLVSKKVGLQGRRASALAEMRKLDPTTVPNRYAIGFDDSGSMGGQPLADAKVGVSNFLGSCSPKDTSVAMYPFGCVEGRGITALSLSCDYTAVNLYVQTLTQLGGTPLHSTLEKMVENEPLTRAVIFSDGAPTDNEGSSVNKAIEKKIPVDTVYIGYGDSTILRSISERTGGIYLRFSDAKTLRTQLKYLSPKYVALLANEELKAKIQRGETI